ncbi:MAG: hypothetical protein M1830_005497 [Pleopsidium flavum]|nr:MAG: hypothetical protein M1830_005497 [Pleopsidium flavum]
MTGEALLADWLRNLEIRNVCPPSPLLATNNTQRRGKAWGETIGGDFEIWRGGERIRDVEMEIQAFEEGYMIATAVTVAQSTSDDPSSAEECSEDFEELDLERDILLAAEAEV